MTMLEIMPVVLFLVLVFVIERTWRSLRSVRALERRLVAIRKEGKGFVSFGSFRRLSPEMIVEVAAHHGLRQLESRVRPGSTGLSLRTTSVVLGDGEPRG